MTLDDAEAFAVSQGWAKFRGEQVWRWVHAHGARSFEEKSNLNRETRARLAEVATIGTLTIAEVQTSSDGTRKLRLVTREWNIAKLMAALKAYPLEQRRRITFEYVLLAGVNDSLRDAAQLAKLLRGVRCKVNIIPWNPHPEAPYARPAPAVIDAFQSECKRLGLPTYLRTPHRYRRRAACGQLANRAKTADGGAAPRVPRRI